MRLESKAVFQQADIIIPISLYNDVFEVPNNKKLLKYLSSRYEFFYKMHLEEICSYSPSGIVIVITDTLHRLSPYLRVDKKLGEVSAREISRNVGNQWEVVIHRILKGLKASVVVERWNESNPKFEVDEEKIKSHRAFQKAVNLYAEKRGFLNKSFDYKEKENRDEKIEWGRKYVLEECRVLLKWMEEYRHLGIAYLGEPNAMITYISNHPNDFVKNKGLNLAKILKTRAVDYYQVLHSMSCEVNLQAAQQFDNLGGDFDNQLFHLCDRNPRTLRQHFDALRHLEPLLPSSKNFDVFQYRNLAHLLEIHIRVGIFFEFISGSEDGISVEGYRYRANEFFRKSESIAELIDLENQQPDFFKKFTARIRLNEFVVSSRWKFWINHFLNDRSGRYSYKMKFNLEMELQGQGTLIHHVYPRIKAEDNLLKLMFEKRSIENFKALFKEIENLLIMSLKNIPEPREKPRVYQWIKSFYLFLDLALLYLTGAQYFFDKMQQASFCLEFKDEENMLKEFKGKKPSNGDFLISELLKEPRSGNLVCENDKPRLPALREQTLSYKTSSQNYLQCFYRASIFSDVVEGLHEGLDKKNSDRVIAEGIKRKLASIKPKENVSAQRAASTVLIKKS